MLHKCFFLFLFCSGVSYFLVVENMLLHIGGVRANLVGLMITVSISLLVSVTSLYGPLATAGGWVFMLLLPLDPSHAGINGMLSKLYPQDRHGTVRQKNVDWRMYHVYGHLTLFFTGEVQGVIEQLSTLGVLGGYPGTLLFSYFVSSDAPFFWPGAAFACSAAYAGMAAGVFYVFIYSHVSGKYGVRRVPCSYFVLFGVELLF